MRKGRKRARSGAETTTNTKRRKKNAGVPFHHGLKFLVSFRSIVYLVWPVLFFVYYIIPDFIV